MKETFFDKFLKFFGFGMSYSTSEDKKKIIWYFGPFTFQVNVTEWENYMWNLYNFKTNKNNEEKKNK